MKSHNQPRTKETDVFPTEIKPVHKGVYRVYGHDVEAARRNRKIEQIAGGTCRRYSYWNGKYWGMAREFPFMAATAHARSVPSLMQDRCWSGLVEPRGEHKPRKGAK